VAGKGVEVKKTIAVLLLIFGVSSAGLRADVPSPVIEEFAPGVTIIRDDGGHWAGPSMGTTHQHAPNYQAKKILDISALPEETFKATREARLRVYFAIQDYSPHMGDKVENGLDESFEVIVNGHCHTYRTDAGYPAKARKGQRISWNWIEFAVPMRELVRGRNEFIFKKASEPKKYDDFIYVGIDDSLRHGNSLLSHDGGKTWTRKTLNSIGATGEYMVRLVLIHKDLRARAVWRLGTKGGRDDPLGAMGYVEQVGGEELDHSLRLSGPDARAVIELDPAVLDPLQPIIATVTCAGDGTAGVVWRQEKDRPMNDKETRRKGCCVSRLETVWTRPRKLIVKAPANAATEIKSISLDFSRPYRPAEHGIDMSPTVSRPAGRPADRPPRCVIGDEVLLENAYLRCRLGVKPALAMKSFESAYLGKNVLADPAQTHLFLVEINGERFGARDFVARGIRPLPEPAKGFEADLLLRKYRVAASLKMSVDDSPELRMSLRLTNEGEGALTFKTAFPHIGGLILSKDEAGDYYLFPYTGGIIANLPTHLRTSYGENWCWWQMIDVFSPEGGAGLYVRVDDTTGLYKSPTLRKSSAADPNYCSTKIGYYMDPELLWEESLRPARGTAMAFEYLRRTRDKGKSFSPPDAVIGVHPGDWHEAMRRYSDWAHKVWKWRPFPSRLHDVVTMVGAGWGQNPLFKDGKYRTDYLLPDVDCVELMSWWEWSELGPWRVPLDQVKEKLGEAFYNRYKHYWVVDPAYGRLRYPLNRGDYVGTYNKAWGGLPALRKHIETIKKAGIVPTLYTDGILACDTTKVGHEYGPKYGVMNPFWTDAYKVPLTPKGYVGAYGSYNMCADTEWWQNYLAKTVRQVLADTGADGLRLDEYGHRGYPCYNKQHKHMFAEPGHNAWLQAVGEACRKVHAAMDTLKPGLILTTEFPGMDYMASHLEGCIVYETYSHVKPIRPVPCNLFAFYFPECKCYDLNPPSVGNFMEWRFWNASAVFGPKYPKPYYRVLKENADVFDSRDREPLIPTLVKKVYANRFRGGGKTVYMLYNARRFTVDQPIIVAEADAAHHFFELVRCKELMPTRADGKVAVGLKIADGRTACIARLPRILRVTGTGRRFGVRLETKPDDTMTLAVCSAKGDRLLSCKPKTGDNELDLASIQDKAGVPACVKLFRGKYLLDAAELHTD